MTTKREQEKKEKPAIGGPLSKKPEWVERLTTGDNRGARAEARKALQDPAATDELKAAAQEVMERTGVDLQVLGAGVAIGAVQLVLVVMLALR